MADIIAPKGEAELSEAVRSTEAPFRIMGGGTKPRGVVRAERILSTTELAGVRLYEPGALTIVVGAGTPLAEVEATLAAEGQGLPFEPMDYRGLLGGDGTPTIGGVVAANVSGPRRVQAGACRDSLIGVRFVDGRGEIVKNGGRVMKNVTGYDLVKLMAGARGVLGVLTELSFKVLPQAPVRASLRLEGLSDDEAVAAMSAALGSPYEVSGAAHDPASGRTSLRLEGFEASIAYRAEALARALTKFGTAEIERDGEAVLQDWAAIRDATALGETGDVWRLSVRPSDAPGLIAKAGAERVLYDWGGGLVWVAMAPGTDLRARLGAFDGHATLVRTETATLPVFHPEPAPLAAIAAGLRAQFDPKGLFNPGLMDPV